jgi:hypothetical protein
MSVTVALLLTLVFALLFVVPTVIAVRDVRSARPDPGVDDSETTASSGQ